MISVLDFGLSGQGFGPILCTGANTWPHSTKVYGY